MWAFARPQAAGKGGYPMKPVRSRLDLLLVSAVIAFAFSMATPSGAVGPRRLSGESLRRTHESAAPGPSTFASVNKPLGIAVTTDRVLVTQFNTDKVRSLDSSGIMTTFATLPPTGNASLERYIAISPGLGGFLAGYVYVTVGKNTYQITADGSKVTRFVTIPSMPNGETGITFDTVGTFGYSMILTDRRGPIWTVDSTGNATEICDVGKQIEGPMVAPTSFVPFGGQIIMGSEFIDQVLAGCDGRVGARESPEGAVLIPSAVCNVGTSRGAYF